MFAVFAAFALAAALQPPLAASRFDTFAPLCERVWTYWCSMLLGATPFLIAGAACSSIVSGFASHVRGAALLVATLCLPVCDCTIASCGQPLARMAPRIAAWVVTLGACCNPPALLVTWLTLGPRLALARMLCGIVAAAGTAWAWQRQRVSDPAATPSHVVCSDGAATRERILHTFVDAASRGMWLFALAAIPASCLIASGLARTVGHSRIVAMFVASILSPCSSSDALLARVLFARPTCQLTFVVAAQCLDIRQMLFLTRTFGVRRAIGAFAASSLAIALCSFLVQP